MGLPLEAAAFVRLRDLHLARNDKLLADNVALEGHVEALPLVVVGHLIRHERRRSAVAPHHWLQELLHIHLQHNAHGLRIP